MIYEPHDDSYLLEKFVKEYSEGRSVLDVGTGSGILAKAAKDSGAKSVLACDVNPNSVNHVLEMGIDCVKSDLFKNIPFEKQFDLILFNPPYLPRDNREDSKSQLITTGGKQGDELTIEFLKQAKNHLSNKGLILIIVSDLTKHDRIEAVIENLGMNKEVLGSKKLFMETLECWKIF